MTPDIPVLRHAVDADGEDGKVGDVRDTSTGMNGEEDPEDASITPRGSPKLVHERQSLRLCALHSLNNLLQQPRSFTKADLDRISEDLVKENEALNYYTVFNPHRHSLGMGDYDVNVITKALDIKGFDMQWFNSSKNDTKSLDLAKIHGFILHITSTPPATSTISRWIDSAFEFIGISSNHWLAVTKVEGKWYNVDSKIPAPVHLSVDELHAFLNYNLKQYHGQLFVIQPKGSSM